MIGLLIYVIFVLLILGLAYWVISLLPLPPPFPLVIQVVIVIIAILVIIDMMRMPGTLALLR